MAKNVTTCWKCAGTGEFHFRDGRIEGCYPCGGTGRAEARIITPARKWTREEQIAYWRLTFRAVYRNIACGNFTAEEAWDAWTTDHWTVEAVQDALDAIGATQAFRLLGWPV